MGDMAEFYRDWDDIKRQRKEELRKQNMKDLATSGLAYEVKNNGFHFIIRINGIRVADFYPTTSKWSVRGGRKGYGFHNLIKSIDSTWKSTK